MEKPRKNKLKAIFKKKKKPLPKRQTIEPDFEIETEHHIPSLDPRINSAYSHQTLWPRLSAPGEIPIVRNKSFRSNDPQQSGMNQHFPRFDSIHVDHNLVPAPLKVQKDSIEGKVEIPPVDGSMTDDHQRPQVRDALRPGARSTVRSLSVYSQWHPEDGEENRPPPPPVPAIPDYYRHASQPSLQPVVSEWEPFRAQGMSYEFTNQENSIDSYKSSPRLEFIQDDKRRKSVEAGLPRPSKKPRTFTPSTSPWAEASSEHLMETPPSSPTKMNFDNKILSEHQNLGDLMDELKLYRKDDIWEQLVSDEGKFQELMTSTTGIREWWHNNVQDWRMKKQEALEAETALIALQRQKAELDLNGLNFLIDSDGKEVKDETFASEVEKTLSKLENEEKIIKAYKNWFIHDRHLIQCIWRRYWDLEIEILSLQYPRPQSMMPSLYRFKFLNCQNHYKEHAMLCENGLLWYFDEARKTIKDYQQSVRKQLKHWRARKEKCRAIEVEHRAIAAKNVAGYHNSESHFDAGLQQLRVVALKDGRIDIENSFLQQLVGDHENQRKQFEVAQNGTNEVVFSHTVEDNLNCYKQNEFIGRLFRLNACLNIVNEAQKQLVKEGNDRVEPDPSTARDIINLLWAESMRWPLDENLDSLITLDQALSKPYTTKNVIHESRVRLQELGMNGKGRSILANVFPFDIYKPDSRLAELFQIWYDDIAPSQRLIPHLESMWKEPEIVPAGALKKWQPPQLPGLPIYPSWGWMPNFDLLKMMSNLNTRQPPEIITHGFRIWRSFNSPDIAPIFWGKTNMSWTIQDFKLLLEELFEDLGDWNYWSDFLKYCNYTGEMFTISRVLGHVYVSPRGWDTWMEAHVSNGFSRRNKYKPPKGLEIIEKALRKHTKEFHMESQDRIWTTQALAKMINKWIGQHKISEEKLAAFFDYWNGVGKFFVRTHLNDAESVTRVDNGWDIPSSNSLIPITSRPLNFNGIANRVQRTDIRPACMRYPKHPADQIYTNENELYNILYGTRACETSLECTRYDFHLYLRCCDQEGGLFKLFRGTDVLVLGRIWGDMGPESITRVEFGHRHGSIKKAAKVMAKSNKK